MQNSKKIILAAVVVILIILGLWSWMKSPAPTSEVSVSDTQMPDDVQVSGANSQIYSDASAKFNFQYPKDYSIKEIPSAEGGETRTLLLSKVGGSSSIQIAISPFDEDIVLTAERIKADVPELEMQNTQ